MGNQVSAVKGSKRPNTQKDRWWSLVTGYDDSIRKSVLLTLSCEFTAIIIKITK
jgi:hypothetical protein